MSQLPKAEDHRKPEYPIESIFYRRWSPRAMSGEALSEKELFTLFEAARWAPSTYNEQEWRFLYGRRDTPQWSTFFNLLMEANKEWCEKAAALVVVVARKTFSRNNKPNPVHVFDAGSSWENLALQATAMGLVAHGMAGFNFNKAQSDLRIPSEYEVCAMIALGRPGDPDELAAELRDREVPTPRRPIKESICEGEWKLPV